ncbi:MAG: EamA family transporter [Ginsengibacter sp.]
MRYPDKKIASPFMVILAFAVVYIVWGSTYFFIQRAEKGFPALILGAFRFIAAGVLMLGWSLLKKENLFVKKDIKNAIVCGILMLFIGNGVVIWVEQYLPSAVVAIMVSSAPVWFVLLDKPMWKQNFSSKSILAGLIIGFAGVILLFSEKIKEAFSTGGNHSELISLGLLIIGAIAWAGGSLYSKYKGTSGSASVNIGWQMLAAGVAFIPGVILRGEAYHFEWQNIPGAAWFSVFYLIFFGSIAGFSAYVWLLQVRPATQVSTYAYVNPVVAVLLGVFFANEKISLLQVIGLITILASVLMINLSKNKKSTDNQNETGKTIALENKIDVSAK